MTQRTWILIGAVVLIVLAVFFLRGGEPEVAPTAEPVAPTADPAAPVTEPAEPVQN
jgi:hypothetical protein